LKFQSGREDGCLKSFEFELDFTGIGKDFEVKDVLEFNPEKQLLKLIVCWKAGSEEENYLAIICST
jgi:hypothetical protein